MSRLPLCFLSLLLLLASGCAKDPSKDAPKAALTEKAPAAEPAAASPSPGQAESAPAPGKPDPATTTSTAVDPKSTTAGQAILGGSVGFVGSKVTGSHECLFREFKATAHEGEVAGEWSLKVEITMGSLFCDPKERNEWSPKLDGHLKSPDFFDIAAHPTALFESTKIRAEVEGEMTHVIQGNLTIRGTTKAISFPAKLQFGDKRVSGQVEFTVSRKDFGITYPGKPDNLIRDGVVLKLQLSGARS